MGFLLPLALACFLQASPDVDRLVETLKTAEGAAMWAAADRLAELGPAAKEAVQVLEKSEDKKLSFPVKFILEEIALREEKPEQGRQIKRFSCAAEGKPAGEVLVEIAKLAEIPFKPSGDLNQPVTVAFEDRPFGEILDGVASAAKLGWSRDSEAGLTVHESNGSACPKFVFRNYKVNATELTRTTSTQFTRNPSTALSLALQFEPDPGTTVLSIDSIKLHEVLDDQGRPLKKKSSASQPMHLRQQREQTLFGGQLSFEDPPEGAKSLSVVRGLARVVVQHSRGDFSFNPVVGAENVVQTKDDVTVTLVKAARTERERQGGMKQYSITLKFENWSKDNGLYDTEFKLKDKKGADYNSWGQSSKREGTAQIYDLNFASWGGEIGEPHTLSFSLVTKTRTEILPFELREIALP